MTNNNGDWLRSLYLAMLRAERNCPWIKLKKEDAELFDELAKTLLLKQMDGLDYIQFHFKYMKGYPSVKYICSIKALQRYEIHQKMKNKYVNGVYALDGDYFYVNRTYKKYPLSQADSGVSQDVDANFALVTAEAKGYMISHDLWEAAEYTMAKFNYKGKTPPDMLVELVNRCREELKYGPD